MQFSYDNLWNTLEKNGLTKADLRQRLGMSSATVAKLSANQPVAMEILGKICDELGCGLNEVVVYESNSTKTSAWSRITEDITYLLKIFFYHKDEKEGLAEYIYGFVTPFQMTEEDLDKWWLNQDDEYLEFYTIDGYLTGKDLQKLINAAIKKMTVGEILELLQIKLKGGNEKVREAILMTNICNGNFVYRPAFLLPSENSCLGIREEIKPLLSFEEECTVCESLFGLNKKALYAEDDILDIQKAKMIWDVLKKELPLHGQLNEIARLNNFEVFSNLWDNRSNDSGIYWKVIDHEDKMAGKKIADALEIHLDHLRLHGRFAINVRTSNTENPFSDSLDIVYCDEEDISYQKPLSESVSHVEIKVWRLGKSEASSELIYHSSVNLIREFHFNMHIHERSVVLEDEWTRKMERANKKIDKKAEFHSNHPFSFGNTENEAWYNEERNVQKDFRQLFGFGKSNYLSGMFFADKTDKSIEFLSWLKRMMKGSGIHRVILIDPYIEVESILKFIRNASNNNIAYEIYTDSCAGRGGGANRIENIKKMKESLSLAAPIKFKVCALNEKEPVLHDRFLILLDKGLAPKVFVLTNSLDGIAQKHASVVTQVNNQVAREVFDYYSDLLGGLEKEVLFDSKEIPVMEEKREKKKLRYEATFDNFKANFEENLSEALVLLAHMQYEEKEKCINFIMMANVSEIADRCVDILEKASVNPSTIVKRAEGIKMLSLTQLMMKDFNHTGNLLQHAESLLDYSYEFSFFSDDWAVWYAAKLLWKINPERYCDLIGTFVDQAKAYKTLGENSICVIIAQMMGVMLQAVHLEKDKSEELLCSRIPLIRAVGIIRVMYAVVNEVREKQMVETDTLQEVVRVLNVLDNPVEIFGALIYLMTSLQTRICRKPDWYEKLQPVIDWIGEEAVMAVVSKTDKGKLELLLEKEELYQYLQQLYFRNSEDICKILLCFWKKKVLSREETTELLIQLCMEKYNKGMADSKEFFRAQDVYESKMIIEYLGKVDKTAINKLKKQMAKLERELSKRLYRAFLKTQNYSLWKSSIDLFCCLVCLELHIARLYPENFPSSRVVEEFMKISENYVSVLENYSEVYLLFKEM